MTLAPEALLVAAVVTVGVAHTVVPDHWLPIAVMARNDGWSRAHTARAAAIAGFGHTVTTLAIGAVVWIAGVALAVRYAQLASLLSSAALIAFGLWIAIAAWLEVRSESGGADGSRHHHGDPGTVRRPNSRMTLLLILGSSPMVEGIPAFFAAARFGPALLAVMAVAFAVSTMTTYVVLCVYAGDALQRLRLGTFERYGEVLSGAVVALVGAIFLVWPVA